MVKKRSLKVKGSISIAIILLWVYFLITTLGGDRYCGIWDYIVNSEEDDACIAKLIKGSRKLRRAREILFRALRRRSL